MISFACLPRAQWGGLRGGSIRRHCININTRLCDNQLGQTLHIWLTSHRPILIPLHPSEITLVFQFSCAFNRDTVQIHPDKRLVIRPRGEYHLTTTTNNHSKSIGLKSNNNKFPAKIPGFPKYGLFQIAKQERIIRQFYLDRLI